MELSHTSRAGDCNIWIEIAGPTTPDIYMAVPNEIRGMAAWIIDQCVAGSGRGYGGFATKDIGKLLDYVTEPDVKISETYRKCTKNRISLPKSKLSLTATLQQPRVHF